MNRAVEAIVETISRELGDEIHALYLYGSLNEPYYQPGKSDVNLLAVVAEKTGIHHLRRILRPVWEKHATVLRRAPLIARPGAFARHMKLNPLLAHHLARQGQQLIGYTTLLDDLPELTAHEVYASLATETMTVSDLLAPDLLEPETAAAHLARLHTLSRRIFGEPVAPDVTAVQLLARIQSYLKHKINKLPPTQPWLPPASATLGSSPLPPVPGLEAIYKETSQTVLVLEDLTPRLIMATDWQDVAQQLALYSGGMRITTSAQIRLLIEFERPLDLWLQRYEHDWGVDPLTGLVVKQWRVLRGAARLPSEIEIDSLPNAYLTEDDEQIHAIIHDFQNKLLNVQLEHELLCRLAEIERFTPPEPLPDKSAPPLQRIDAIFQHAAWWADHYTKEMLNAA